MTEAFAAQSRSRNFARHAVAAGAILVAAAFFAGAGAAQELKKYDSQKKDFWQNPPPDWFLGDETQAQKGQKPVDGPATGLPAAEIEANLKKIKLPPGFSISLWAAGVNSARQMAWGEKGTLFVGAFGVGNVYAIVDKGGTKEVKVIIKGLRMPTGLAYRDGTLYVADIDKIYAYEKAEDMLDAMPQGKVVYDDLPPYVPHGWKYLVFDKEGWLYVPVGVPCNICIPPTSTGQIRRVDPKTGAAQIVALGQRNSVGGDVDPRTGHYWFSENARDWLSNDGPSDKLNVITRPGAQHFGYPHCHQGDMPDPKLAMGRKCAEFTPPVLKLGAHVAPLGMKFYTGNQFPAQYKNNIFLAQHGSWNRAKFQGARIMRIVVDPQGKTAKEEVFASGWLAEGNKYLGRPADILVGRDGSLMVADDWAGAIYQISYKK
jgi:glucose/arabinose dehydrogenase